MSIFGDESFQSSTCTGADNQTQKNQEKNATQRIPKKTNWRPMKNKKKHSK